MNRPSPFERDALTFDDVLLLPGYSEVLPAEIDLSVELAPGIRLGLPILSSAMDTVTEARLAIALAREGGLGVVHRNLSIEEQAAEVDKVKRSESGMIVNPITLRPDAPLQAAETLMSTYRISGVPITDEAGYLVGILTNRDIRFARDLSKPVSAYMTADNLVTAPLGTTLDDAMTILQEHRIEKLPLVDEAGLLVGLITVKDIQKKRDFPHAALDHHERLLVGAAVGAGADFMERAVALVAARADVLVVDTAHGHSRNVLEAVRRLRERFPDQVIFAGNVATPEGALALIEAGANAIKVGIGSGSICTTRIVSGVGVPQVSAVWECVQAARERGVPVISDGGIKYSGDAVKALAVGAHAVMLGSLLAGLEESPGEVVIYQGERFKDYRGMGSLGAMRGPGRDRYAQGRAADGRQAQVGKLVPEGIEGRVPYKGSLADFVYQVAGGIQAGMGYVGAASLPELWDKACFRRITNAGLIESHPHGVFITKEAPNYQERPCAGSGALGRASTSKKEPHLAEIREFDPIQGVQIAELRVWADERGRFAETFRKEWFPQRRWECVQSNRSDSRAGVLRGLHYHFHQVDYWLVMRGTIRVGLADLRPTSPTYRQSATLDLSEESAQGLYIPVGVAHGFVALTDATLTYMVDNYHDGSDELGVAWDDPQLAVPWGVSAPVLSPRDQQNRPLASIPPARLPK